MSSDKDSLEVERNTMIESLRMWSAASFALIILGLGLPLWWKTTEVYRVSLPYSEIDQLQHLEHRTTVNISVYTEYPSRTNKHMVKLNNAFSSSKLFNVLLFPAKLDIGKGTIAELEHLESKTDKTPGSFRIIETGEIQLGTIVVGNYRALYFHPDENTETIVQVLKKWIFREEYMEDMIGSMEEPGSRSGQDRRLKSEPCFDIIFSVVNPEPDQVKVIFDAEATIRTVIDPLLNQLKPLADLTLKTQWLYFVDIGSKPKRKPNYVGSIITFDRIPHIISPLEKKLGSGVSSCSCLHFVLYIPRCADAPLFFSSSNGSLDSAVVSPKWGGIQIHNPSKANCENKTNLILKTEEIAKTFVTHLRYLLDLHYQELGEAKLLTLKDSPLRDWEVDSLYYSRILEQAVSARLTLQSLSRLLAEISNIVINEEVGDAIKMSVNSTSTTLSTLSEGRLEDALVSARRAYVAAETAFSHPSLLALLYFPDDQKYAVYIPLFLPVMIPVLLSLKNIWKWFAAQ